MSNIRYRNFVFTLNNYTDEEQKQVQDLPCTYLIYGRELGEEKTPHLQGYCELEKQTGFKALKKMLPRAHIEKRKGTAAQAAEYCKKEGDFEEFGTISKPGARTDIETFVKDITSGKTKDEIIDLHPVSFVKFPRAFNDLMLHTASKTKAWKPVEVHIRWGPPGSLKSSYAMKQDPDVYLVPDPACKWFDLYYGQKSILIDEMYGQCPYPLLLRLLDGYPFALPIKGGFTWKAWDVVYITSNKHPSEWYPVEGMSAALARRITSITETSMPTEEEKLAFFASPCEIVVAEPENEVSGQTE